MAGSAAHSAGISSTDMVVAQEETFGSVARSTASRPTRKRWPTTPNSVSPPIFYSRDIGRHLACCRGARIRHHRHQRGHHLAGDRPVRRQEGGIGRADWKYGIEENSLRSK